MRKFFQIYSVILVLLFLPLSVQAVNIDATKVMPTVKVMSFQYTRNGAVNGYSQGSATLISKDGLILTNNHVVVDDENEPLDIFEVCLTSNGKADKELPICEYTASLVARNEDLDLALLKLHSKDIRGANVPALPFLTYGDDVNIKSGDTVSVVGYPGTGGDTVTITKGQVSGYEVRDGVSYIKTDTDISSGNSGGTALSADGNFVGVPTYVRASIGSLGYFLDIREAKSWIDEHRVLKPDYNSLAQKELAARMRLVNDANYSHTYNHPHYPSFSFSVPPEWRFEETAYSSVAAGLDSNKKNYTFSVQVYNSPVAYTPEVLQEKFFKKIDKQKKDYKNFKREEVHIGGKAATVISYDFSSTKATTYLIPYGYALLTLHYQTELKDEVTDQKVYQSILDSFRIADEIQSAPKQANYLIHTDPPFSISAPVGWSMLENKEENSEELILSLEQKNNFEGQMLMYYDKFTQSEKKMSAEDLLQEVLSSVEYRQGFRLVNKNSEVFIDGLPGFSISYVYAGEEYGQTRKKSLVYLIHGDYYYTLSYEDLDQSYDANENDFKILLRSFRNRDPFRLDENHNFQLGSLNQPFKDITYHRFEREIANLRDKEIVKGYDGGYFYPERKITRLEAFLIMMRARLKLLEEQQNTTLADELEKYQEVNADLEFTDITDTEAQKYLRYARDKKIISGYANNRFEPNRSISLAETLKLLIEIFELPVWTNQDDQSQFPWYKPYMYQAYDMGIVPGGIGIPETEITRAELAAIIVNVMETVE